MSVVNKMVPLKLLLNFKLYNFFDMILLHYSNYLEMVTFIKICFIELCRLYNLLASLKKVRFLEFLKSTFV